MLPSLPSLALSAAALLFVLALVWIAQRAARLGGLAPRTGAGRRIVVAETTALDPRRRLHLVRCDGAEVLLLTGGTRDLVVGWLSRDRQP